MDALSGAGVPVFAERGRGGGWSLLEGYRTPLTGLNEPEIQTLLLNTPSQLLADLGLEKAAHVALLKLLATLPNTVRHDAEFFRQRIHFDTGQWFGSQEDTPCLPLLQDALWHDAQIEMAYQRGDGDIVTRVLNPLGLVAKGHIWYLVAAVAESIRTYRVSRIQSVTLTGGIVQRSPDFDLAAYWQQSTQEFLSQLPHYTVTLRVDSALLPKIKAWRYAQVEDVSETESDGWVTIHADFETLDVACERVLSLGMRALVVEPDELRAQVVTQAGGSVALYG
jgi:predicted DNA-binding transcriptional regulator YafY